MYPFHRFGHPEIGFNYALACNWNDGLLGFFYGSWTTIQMNGFMVCHLAIPVFFLEDVLRNRCRMDVRIHYGVCHFAVRELERQLTACHISAKNATKGRPGWTMHGANNENNATYDNGNQNRNGKNDGAHHVDVLKSFLESNC